MRPELNISDLLVVPRQNPRMLHGAKDVTSSQISETETQQSISEGKWIQSHPAGIFHPPFPHLIVVLGSKTTLLKTVLSGLSQRDRWCRLTGELMPWIYFSLTVWGSAWLVWLGLCDLSYSEDSFHQAQCFMYVGLVIKKKDTYLVLIHSLHWAPKTLRIF